MAPAWPAAGRSVAHRVDQRHPSRPRPRAAAWGVCRTGRRRTDTGAPIGPSGHQIEEISMTHTTSETADDPVAEGRERIDALDDRIIALIRERMTVSDRIQRARLASGGRRIQLAREMEILGRYREALGRPGTQLAMTLLELSRGRA
ncbi:chorismate mutase [Streptomyces radicis]|uniref:Chorismate mutase n=1 Tax=Streptomyces radicis TaxID=1750517 RepID=A0A3A9W4H2_9ACTN|nr:chorismate mutase [Streptomyces radicis]RKN08068.1 chorismate mutase [Streptomyces radicis]RKN20423.1 chorismate mutase [Streptomyces radicis]